MNIVTPPFDCRAERVALAFLAQPMQILSSNERFNGSSVFVMILSFTTSKEENHKNRLGVACELSRLSR